MPVHDWTRVEAGTYHSFHSAWITHLMETMNNGLLPGSYYALSEQHMGRRIGDVLALHAGEDTRSPVPRSTEGAVLVVDVPPRVRRKLSPEPRSAYRALRRTLAVRSLEGHRIVALVEILSPGNKDREANVEEFALKVESALNAGIHVLVVDLFRPGPFDAQGIHGAIWAGYDSNAYDLPAHEPLTLASYEGGAMPEAYVEHLALGQAIPVMPLFLEPGAYIDVPLEATYEAAFRGMPALYRSLLERSDA
jgi:hypothetical protein